MHAGILASTIVNAILAELNGRKGFDWWWDDLDEDIRQEITDELKLQTLALLEHGHD